MCRAAGICMDSQRRRPQKVIRIFHNPAVIRRKDGTYRECPAFANGAALFSGVRGDYPLDMTEEECHRRIKAKLFSRDF